MGLFDSVFSGVKSIVDQTTKVINSNLKPLKETIKAVDLVTDAKDIAEKTFTSSKVHIPSMDSAYRAAYDHSQGVSRLMKLYTYARSDFYDIFTENKDAIANQLAQTKAVCERLAKRGAEASKRYSMKDE